MSAIKMMFVKAFNKRQTSFSNHIRSSCSSGFTLIEILVSIVILTVGILGVTAMQSASLNGGVAARSMDSAVNVASEALDRIQANVKNIGDYGATFTVAPVDDSDTDPTNNGERPSGSAAAADYDSIYNRMREMNLGLGTLTITFQYDTPVTGVNTASAVVSWNNKSQVKRCRVTYLIASD